MKTGTFVCAAACVVASGLVWGGEESATPRHAFFPFCIDTHDSEKRSLEEQAELLKELGYDGVGHLWLDNIEERLQTLDARGLKLFQITVRVNLADGKPPYDPRLKAVMPALRGRDVQIALIMQGLPPSDPKGDARAVEIVRDLADAASEYGVEIVIYPHTGDWVQRIEDAVRLAKKAQRKNVGVMFNLCHWLKVDGKQDLSALLTEAKPYLVAVSIHGADTAEEVQAGAGNWIQPLGEGSYDVMAFLRLLDGLGYRGPVGLQCWGIQGDARSHLTKSMAAWRKYQPE